MKQGDRPRTSLFASSLAFVGGFSLVFISFGASASAVGQFLLHNKTLLAPFAGAVIVLVWAAFDRLAWAHTCARRLGCGSGAGGGWRGALGYARARIRARRFPAQLISVSLIFLAGPTLTRWLNRDVRFRNLGGQSQGRIGKTRPLCRRDQRLFAGLCFRFRMDAVHRADPCWRAGAWRPPAEPSRQGVFLLAVYSAGLAIPFLLTALGINQFLRFYQRFRRHLAAVEVASGGLLLAVGGLIFVNRLTWLSGKLSFLNRFVK